jgi:hypothetical protein
MVYDSELRFWGYSLSPSNGGDSSDVAAPGLRGARGQRRDPVQVPPAGTEVSGTEVSVVATSVSTDSADTSGGTPFRRPGGAGLWGPGQRRRALSVQVGSICRGRDFLRGPGPRGSRGISGHSCDSAGLWDTHGQQF